MFVLSEYLNGVLALDPSADAIEFERQWFTWGQLAGQVAAIRAQLTALGLGAEARVGIMVRNRPDSVYGPGSVTFSGRWACVRA